MTELTDKQQALLEELLKDFKGTRGTYSARGACSRR